MMLRTSWFAILILTLSGCFTEDANLRITSYLAQDPRCPDASEGVRVAVLASTIPREHLLERELQKKIEVLLRQKGFDVSNLGRATHLLFAVASMDSGHTVEDIEPVYQPGMTARSHSYGSQGWSNTTTRIPGHFDYVPTSYTMYTALLTMQMVDKTRWETGGKDHLEKSTTWKSKTLSESHYSDLRGELDYMLVGTIEYLGKDSGKEVLCPIPRDSRRIKRFREAVAAAPTPVEGELFGK